MVKQLAVAFVCICCGIAEAGTGAKVVFVGKEPDHPFGTHMYMHTGNVLSKCLKLTGGVETVVSQGWPKDTRVLAPSNTPTPTQPINQFTSTVR